ncbi:accessory gene regulator ArgB-like protein [Clostridium diolis]|jgi:accessory gene regulator B|nr:accessory gene regulator ArgB-like protein [Clostridium diolis]
MEVDLSKKALSEEIALKLVAKINRDNQLDNVNYKKMKYGLEVIIINLSKTSFILLIAFLLGILQKTLTIMLSFAFIRRYAFGIHAKNSISCTILTSIYFFTGAYIPNFIHADNYMILLMFSTTILLLYLYAPADTDARPLTGRKLRKSLKKKALLSGSILMTLTFFINDFSLKFFISYGALCEALTIIPIIYKLFNRRYKNYEYYQRNID